MTILRNTFWRRATMLAVAMIALIALAACERAADTTDPLSAVARSDNGNPGDVGNAAGGPLIGVRLLVNKAGVAVLEVSTAPFATSSATPVPNGLLKDVKYKLIDSTGKLRYEESIKFRIPVAAARDTLPPTLRKEDKGNKIYPAVRITPAWKVLVEAHVVGFVDPACALLAPNDRERDALCKKNDDDSDKTRVRSAAFPVANNPDVDVRSGGDLSVRPIYRSVGSPRILAPLDQVTKDIVLDYVLAVSNTGPRDVSTVGVLATCTVLLDNAPVAEVYWEQENATTPDVSSAVYIAPNTTRLCHWRAKATTVGQHAFTVTANAIDPGDYDLSNNAVTQSFEVVNYAPVGGGVGANSLGVTLGERAWFGETGGIVELTGQSTNLNNFTVPALTAADAAASRYDVRMLVTTGHSVLNNNLVDGVVMSDVRAGGSAPAVGGCALLTPAEAGLVDPNRGAIRVELCLDPVGSGVEARLNYSHAVPTRVPADMPAGIMLFRKYVKVEMTVTRTLAGVAFEFGGAQRLVTDITPLSVGGYGTPDGAVRGTSLSYTAPPNW